MFDAVGVGRLDQVTQSGSLTSEDLSHRAGVVDTRKHCAPGMAVGAKRRRDVAVVPKVVEDPPTEKEGCGRKEMLATGCGVSNEGESGQEVLREGRMACAIGGGRAVYDRLTRGGG